MKDCVQWNSAELPGLLCDLDYLYYFLLPQLRKLYILVRIGPVASVEMFELFIL